MLRVPPPSSVAPLPGRFTPGKVYAPPFGYRVDARGRAFDLATGAPLTVAQVNARYRATMGATPHGPTTHGPIAAVLPNYVPPGWAFVQAPGVIPTSGDPIGTWHGPNGQRIRNARATDTPWQNAPATVPVVTRAPAYVPPVGLAVDRAAPVRRR